MMEVTAETFKLIVNIYFSLYCPLFLGPGFSSPSTLTSEEIPS